MKFCKNCKWFSNESLPGLSLYLCQHPDHTEHDLVTGKVRYPICENMREGACGKKGKLWELKKEKK